MSVACARFHGVGDLIYALALLAGEYEGQPVVGTDLKYRAEDETPHLHCGEWWSIVVDWAFQLDLKQSSASGDRSLQARLPWPTAARNMPCLLSGTGSSAETVRSCTTTARICTYP